VRPDGISKTTLFRTITGEGDPDEGQIVVSG
jgi:ABC-type branched-subunit amino acid transport system ATPase component